MSNQSPRKKKFSLKKFLSKKIKKQNSKETSPKKEIQIQEREVILTSEEKTKRFEFMKKNANLKEIFADDLKKIYFEEFIQDDISEKGSIDKKISQPLLEKIEKQGYTKETYDETAKQLEKKLFEEILPKFIYSPLFTSFQQDIENVSKGINAKGPTTLRTQIIDDLFSFYDMSMNKFKNFSSIAISTLKINSDIFQEKDLEMFSNFEQILSLHETLFKKLQYRKRNWHFQQTIGDIFLDSFEKLASLHKQNSDEIVKSLEIYSRLTSQKTTNSVIKKLVKKEKLNFPEGLKLPLNFHEELNRIIATLVENTKKSFRDYEVLNQFSEQFNRLCQDTSQERILITKLLEPDIKLFKGHTLLKEGMGRMKKYTKNTDTADSCIYLFLFTEIIAWGFLIKQDTTLPVKDSIEANTKKIKSGIKSIKQRSQSTYSEVDSTRRFKIDNVIPLNSVWIKCDKNFNSQNSKHLNLNQFEIITPELRMTVAAKNSTDWVQQITEAIEKRLGTKSIETRTGEFCLSSKVILKGSLTEGVLKGHGEILYPNGSVLVSEFEDGKAVGKGKMSYITGDSVEAEFKDNLPNGNGVFLFRKGAKFIGSFSNGNMSGKAKLVSSDGSIYEGEFLNDLFEGKGTLKFANGDFYSGSFKDNMRSGIGEFKDSLGNFYKGSWRNDRREGHGKQIYVTGDSYEGSWVRDQKQGTGTFITKYWKYKGSWKNDLQNGQGLMEYSEDKKYEGEWKNGMRSGRGIFINKNIKYTGEWSYNLPNGYGTLYILKSKNLSSIKQNIEPEDILEQFTGIFKDGISMGKEIHYHNSENVQYTGEMSYGNIHNKGILSFSDDTSVKGFWDMDRLILKSTTLSVPNNKETNFFLKLNQENFLSKDAQIWLIPPREPRLHLF
ncbi:phosphatidylinositol-4-phosphate 5-kinase related [Anaeramoeba ignava]|uniref:Phosphatidylinositol-4-phosphate 5-kinase related n=1 Tax=Anaeramoeba ignava TaxID=1746090 RepID=A0A9Q0RHP5_ANAIG|nr:phosphatidylinositol-4-phosphate 5-kinase related [Anaeramoeba ignava]